MNRIECTPVDYRRWWPQMITADDDRRWWHCQMPHASWWPQVMTPPDEHSGLPVKVFPQRPYLQNVRAHLAQCHCQAGSFGSSGCARKTTETVFKRTAFVKRVFIKRDNAREKNDRCVYFCYLICFVCLLLWVCFFFLELFCLFLCPACVCFVSWSVLFVFFCCFCFCDLFLLWVSSSRYLLFCYLICFFVCLFRFVCSFLSCFVCFSFLPG